MAWVLLESDKAAMAAALGAVPKCPPPHAFMKPIAKPWAIETDSELLFEEFELSENSGF